MRIYILILSLLILSFTIHAQNQVLPKIKILLLGSVHFTPSSQDTYKNEVVNVDDTKRKQEIDEVVKQLVEFQPNQVCIEMPVSKQLTTDSIYQQFLIGKYKLKPNEIDQLALPLAKKLGLKKVTCVNYLGQFGMKPVTEYAQANGQSSIMTALDSYGKSFMVEIAQRQKDQSVKDFLNFLNTSYALNKNSAIYTDYLVRVGKDETYIGTDLVADWYATNLHIYTNILRSIQPSDKAILVLFGQGHIPILKHLFGSNALFEIVEVEKILK